MSKRIKVSPENPDPKAIELAVSILKRGGVIVYPTDTLYGLGADATNVEAVKKVFDIKGRLYSQPLPILISDVDMLYRFADEVPQIAIRLAKKFWHGALTIVVWARRLNHLGSEKVGFRAPAHRVPLEIIRLLGSPLVGTSANIAQQYGADDPDEIERQIGRKIDLMLDCGKLRQSIPSTVVDATEYPLKIIRAGAVKIEDIEKFLAESNNKHGD